MKSDFLRSEIESDITTRERNLTLIKTLPSRYPGFREEDKKCWERCSFPIIYAEWEGFFVSAFRLYLREISKENLMVHELSDHYLLHESECRFKQLKEYPSELKRRHKFIKNLLTFYRDDSPLTLVPNINTESNLGFNVMNNILGYFCLNTVNDHIDNNAYSLKDDMDKFLLNTRNGIAHGDARITASTEEITKAISLVTRLMHIIKDILCSGVEAQVYRI